MVTVAVVGCHDDEEAPRSLGDLSSRGVIVDGNADDRDKEKKRTSGGAIPAERKRNDVSGRYLLSLSLSFSSSFSLFR